MVDNLAYIAKVLSNNWGFWFDAKVNLEKVLSIAAKFHRNGKVTVDDLSDSAPDRPPHSTFGVRTEGKGLDPCAHARGRKYPGSRMWKKWIGRSERWISGPAHGRWFPSG